MRILIAGGSGFLGRPLCELLLQHHHQVTVLSRNPAKAASALPAAVSVIAWDALTRGQWERTLDTADAVINLAGEPIADQRWTAQRKQLVRNSRTTATCLLVQAIGRASPRPSVLVNASGIGYYGPCDARPVTEQTPAGSGFLAEMSVAWEQEAMAAEAIGLRVVRLRIGIVLALDGGALPRMALPFRFFLGGPVGSGTQWISWIHREDLLGLIRWALTNPAISGPVNGVAPGAVAMRDFCRTLGEALNRPCWFPVPEFVLRLALGEMAVLLTTGQRVEPTVALRGGYVFRYPALKPALEAIVRA